MRLGGEGEETMRCGGKGRVYISRMTGTGSFGLGGGVCAEID